MANSLLLNNTSLVTFSIIIDGAEIPNILEAISIEVNLGLNRIPYAQIKLRDGGSAEENSFEAGNSANFEPGKEIEIKMGYESKNKTIFKGIITRHAIKISESGGSYLIVECRDKAVKMTIGRKNEIYLKKKDSDILSQIIQAHGLQKDVETTTDEHEQLLQHYATDWDFVLMRADINGLVVCVDKGKLIIKKPDFSAAPKYEIEYGITLFEIDAEVDARNQYKKATAIGWDSENQKIIKATGVVNSGTLAGNFTSSKLAAVIGLDDYVIQSPANATQGLLKTWATAKLTKSKMAMIQGSVTFRGVDNVIPGDMLELKGLSDRFNGKIFIEGVKHTLEEGDWKTIAKIGMSDEWHAETFERINAPQASGYTPAMQGLTVGVVTKIHEDPEGSYRVQVKLPVLDKDSFPIWARMSSLYGSGDAGIFFYPEVNDEVIIGFLNNDPQNPIIIGSVFSKKNKSPLEPNDKNNEKAIITKSKLKLHFEEEKKIITLETPGGNKIVMDDDAKSITIEDLNGNKMVMGDAGINLESPKDIIIKATGKISIEATDKIDVKSSGGDLSGEGINVKLKGSAGFAAEGAMAELKGSAQTTIKGGIVMIN